jgi:hypothetical protein
MSLIHGGAQTDITFWLPDLHAGTMTPMAVGSLATLAGLFIVLDARAGDGWLRLAPGPTSSPVEVTGRRSATAMSRRTT